MSTKIQKVLIDGFTIEYIKFGTGEKTLVILPGLSLKSVLPYKAAIEKHYEIFKDDYTVYLFDRRKQLPETYSVYDMARDTADAIKVLNLKNVYIFGASQGGMIGMTIASMCPDLVDGLAVSSTSAFVDANKNHVIGKWITLLQEKKTEELVLYFSECVYPESYFQENKRAFKQLAKLVTDDDIERVLRLLKGTFRFDLRDKLSNINCPFIAIGDYDDAVFGTEPTLEIADIMKDRKDFEYYFYNGFGHAVYDMAPDFTQRIFDFFEKKGAIYSF